METPKEFLEKYDPQIVGYENYLYTPEQVIERLEEYRQVILMEMVEDEWLKAKQEVKDLIHPKYFDFIESNEAYNSHGIVEIYEVPEKQNGYPESQRNCRVSDEHHGGLYMLTTSEVEYFEEVGDYEGEEVEYWVNQWNVGLSGDSYSGVFLFRLNNGKYWKVGYCC